MMRNLEDIPTFREASNARSPLRRPRHRLLARNAQTAAKQQMCLDFLQAGDSPRRAAERIAIRPQLIDKWRGLDPEFAAAYTEAVKTAADKAAERIVGLLPRAVDVAEATLEAQDPKLAWDGAYKLLKGRGMLTDSLEVQGAILNVNVPVAQLTAEELRLLLADIREQRKALPGPKEGDGH